MASYRSPGINVPVWFAGSGGLVAAGTGALLLAQMTLPRHADKSYWFAVSVLLLLGGAVVFIYAVIAAVRRALETRNTPFKLVHDSDDHQCVQFGGLEGGQVRVKVTNTGHAGLNHVRARLLRAGGYDHWLRIRHDNTEPFVRSQAGEILPASDEYSVYFDVAWISWNQLAAEVVFYQYADAFLRDSSPSTDRTQSFDIVVWGNREDDGRTVRPCRKKFTLELAGIGTPPTMRESP